MRYQLERKYPGLQVTPVATTAQDWLPSADLAELDGIILALGSPSVERAFSRHLMLIPKPLPLVFTWLEALDLGGHSVLMWSNSEGCLDCLYRDEEGQAALYPRTSFLEPNQHLSRNLTGCASTFVPFGAIQARRTGLIAAEHMLSTLYGNPKPSYRFWVGEGTAAVKQGLRTTNWWKVAGQTTQAEATQRVFGRACKHCRGTS
ncbi:hypothetical protein I0E98_10725 [Pseudomonas lalucatii]|nr:hypothetical protein [Pseudomonas lalucatii]